MFNLTSKQTVLLITAVLLGVLVLLSFNTRPDEVLQAPGEIDPKSPEILGYWSFDPDSRNSTHIYDLSIYGNDGIIHGAEFVRGADGEAAYFDGLDDYIEIPDPNNIFSGMNQLTIAFHIKISDKVGPQAYLFKNNVWGPFSFRTYGNLIDLQPFIRNASLDYRPGPHLVTIIKDEFIHYVFTYNETDCFQYINSLFVRSDSCVSGGIWSGSGSLFIGKNHSGGDPFGYFNGAIDELVILNKSLSDEEVKQTFRQFDCGDGVCGSLENSFVCYEDCFDQSSAGKFLTTTNYTIWYLDSTQKILPTFPAPENSVSRINLNIAKNEARTIQLAVTSNVQSKIPISTSSDSELTAKLYTEETVPVITPSDHIPHFTGNIYDPLTKKDFLSLEEEKTSVILVEIKTNATVHPGDYVVEVVIDNETIPINVHVYDFALPDKLTLATAFDSGHFKVKYEDIPDCEAASVFEFHGLEHNPSGTNPDERAIIDAYYEDYAENKIVPYAPHVYRGAAYNCDTREFDFTVMDATLDYYLNNLSMNAAMIFHYSGWYYERAYSLCRYNITQPEYAGIAIQYYQNLTKHLEEKGWLNRSYIMIDEPHGIHLNYTKDLATIVTKNTTPPLRIGPALNDYAAFAVLNNSANLWIIQNNEGASLPLFAPERGVALLNQGDEIWWYYTSSKVFDIDSPALDNTLNYWAAWKYNVTGILNWGGLIYDTHCADNPLGQGMDNPWRNPRSSWGNGQINFYYPPCIDVCAEPTFEVVPSLRVKLYREGIQDYEYFEILKNKISEAQSLGINTLQAESALTWVVESAISPISWTNDPSLVSEIRQEVAEQIEHLQREIDCGHNGCDTQSVEDDRGSGGSSGISSPAGGNGQGIEDDRTDSPPAALELPVNQEQDEANDGSATYNLGRIFLWVIVIISVIVAASIIKFTRYIKKNH